MSFRIHFQDVRRSDGVRHECERLADALREEFPETSKVEVTVTHDGQEHGTLVHITGKDLDVAARAQSKELRDTVTDAFDRIRRQLRKHHDKLISRRRGAQKAGPAS